MKKNTGFTLIEMMITVAVIGILAAIAYPSYRSYVIRSHQSSAKALLYENAHAMERQHTTSGSYVNAALPYTQYPETGDGIYTITLVAASTTADSYLLRASPMTGQGVAMVGTEQLQVDENGSFSCAVAGVQQSCKYR